MKLWEINFKINSRSKKSQIWYDLYLGQYHCQKKKLLPWQQALMKWIFQIELRKGSII